MRMLLILSLLTWSSWGQIARPVILAASDEGRIQILDPGSLSTLGQILVDGRIESVSANPDGHHLYIARENKSTSAGCGLFALDLETKQMCPLVSPALYGAPSYDGRLLFTQRDAKGVDVFDGTTMARLPSMNAHGFYSLYPSPGGSMLFGVTNRPSPSVDIFDTERKQLIHRIPLPSGPATGAFVGWDFYVFSYGEGGGRLWQFNAGSSSLPVAKPVSLPDLHGSCNEPVLLMLAGGPKRLFLAEVFGFKVDRRRACADAARSGVYAIDPITGRVEYHFADQVHVNRMVVSEDGDALYVIDSSGAESQSSVRLLHLDAWTGRILATHELQPGVWNLSLAHIAGGLTPYGFHPKPCDHK